MLIHNKDDLSKSSLNSHVYWDTLYILIFEVLHIKNKLFYLNLLPKTAWNDSGGIREILNMREF